MNFSTPFTYVEFKCPSLQLPQLRNFEPPKLCFSCAEEGEWKQVQITGARVSDYVA